MNYTWQKERASISFPCDFLDSHMNQHAREEAASARRAQEDAANISAAEAAARAWLSLDV